MNRATRVQPGQLSGLFSRLCIRQAHQAAQNSLAAPQVQYPEGHGENVWVFAHRRSHQVVYTFDSHLDGFHDLKQLPFNGKKTKPTKFRKDYWRPMAQIRFQPGQGSIGRSVFQKLRELKFLHEVAWADEFRFKKPIEFTNADRKKIKQMTNKAIVYRPRRTKAQRGRMLNAQKKNAIADIAAVLGGKGRGNKVAVEEKDLVDVVVSWANDHDKNYAESWTENVTHDLFPKPSYVLGKAKKVTTPEATETVS